MEYRSLGKTGLNVSALCLGTMTFAREADEQTSHALLDQLNDNLGAADFALTNEQRGRLDAASALPLPYPYDFIANAAQRDFGRVITAR